MQLLSLACPGGDRRQILGRGSGQPASRCSPKERAPLLAEPPQHLRSQQERGHPRAKCQGMKGGRTLQGERAGEGGDREKRGLGQESKLMALHHPPVRSASPGGPGRCRWTQEGTPTELPCPPPAVCQAPTPFHAQKEHQSQSKNPFFLTK